MKFFSQKGFTLIELLVVIAIIGILSLLISSSLFGSTQKAGAVKASNDLSQMMIAMEMATSDIAILTEWPETIIGPACPEAGAHDTISSSTVTYMKLRCPSAGYTYTVSGIVSGSSYISYSFSATFSDGGTFTCAGGACLCDNGTLCKQ